MSTISSLRLRVRGRVTVESASLASEQVLMITAAKCKCCAVVDTLCVSEANVPGRPYALRWAKGCPLSVQRSTCDQSSAMRCSEESTAVNFWMDVLTFAKHKLPTVATRACGNFTAEPESSTAASEE